MQSLIPTGSEAAGPLPWSGCVEEDAHQPQAIHMVPNERQHGLFGSPVNHFSFKHNFSNFKNYYPTTRSPPLAKDLIERVESKLKKWIKTNMSF